MLPLGNKHHQCTPLPQFSPVLPCSIFEASLTSALAGEGLLRLDEEGDVVFAYGGRDGTLHEHTSSHRVEWCKWVHLKIARDEVSMELVWFVDAVEVL